MYSVRLHLDPSVQAAGEHHPTDLKTGSVRGQKSAAPCHRGRLQTDAIDRGDREVKGDDGGVIERWRSMELVTMGMCRSEAASIAAATCVCAQACSSR